MILYLSEARDSYAVAGLVDGAFGLGAAVGVPLQSRLIDRFGQRRVLLPAAVFDATATGGLIALAEGGPPTAALVACGLLVGFAPGTAIGGLLVEEAGWEACFVAAAAFAALGAVVVWWYRGTLSPD